MNKKKIMSLIMALVMLVGVFSPLSAFADGDGTTGDQKPAETNGPATIEVNVHKILMTKEQLKNHDTKKKYDPTKGIQNITDFFGEGASQIKGVYFVAISEDETELYAMDKDTFDPSKITDWDTREGNKTAGLTGDDGVLKLTLANNKKYKIFEVKSKSTYVGDSENEKKILAEQLAIPVEIELPKHAETPTGTATSIHVYPKNTEDGPKVTKKVIKNDQDKDLASFDMKKEFKWAIEADIPTGFKDYKVFELSDTLQATLSYVKNQTVTVKVKDKDNISLEKGTDYTLTEPTEEKGGTLKVALTETGIKKLAQSGAEGSKLRVEFATIINEDAVMSTDIPNKVTLKYGHDPKNTHEKESNEPKVYTGGKKFKKIDSSQNDKALKDAKFVVKNAEGKYLFEKNGRYVWETSTETDVTKLAKLEGIKILTSGADGTFVIKGLEYDENDRTTGTKYFLKEIEAPKDYALLKTDIEFFVNDNSFKDTATAVPQKLDAQNNQLVDNKPITIPQTGGMGTVLFTVVGISLMAGAVIAMKRNREEA